ncbi:MAG: hypothetical protein ABSC76_04370 [Terracidiphilus sp.]|jgi:hypothetical protein
MDRKTNNPANRNYHIRLFAVMALYALALIATSQGFDLFHLTGALAYLLALLPALPVVATIAVIGLYLAEQKDEFLRGLLIESMLWGVGATLALTTVWGSLQKFAHIRGLDLFLVYPICCVFVYLARFIVKLRYR